MKDKELSKINLADFTDKNAKFRKDMEKYTKYAKEGKLTGFPFEPYNISISNKPDWKPMQNEEEK